MKKGISAIVATVLIILITVSAVTILWTAVIPIVRDSLEFRDLDARVEVAMSEGYTAYDASREVAMVQVRRYADEVEMNRVKISFGIEGNTYSNNVVAPEAGNTKVYSFDLSDYGVPDSVSVAPIFVSSSGSEKEGVVTSEVSLTSGTINDVLGVAYGVEGDSDLGIPEDGLISSWSFSGDATDGVGSNDCTVYGDGNELVDGVLVLDGFDDYGDCGNAVDLTLPVEQTISAWISVEGHPSAWARFVGKGAINIRNYGLWLAADGDILYQLYAGASYSNFYNNVGVGDAMNFPVGLGWHHVVGVYSGTNGKVYIDGVEAHSSDDSVVGHTSNEPLLLGGGIHEFFYGSMDNVMVYNRVLSADEVLSIYEAQLKG